MAQGQEGIITEQGKEGIIAALSHNAPALVVLSAVLATFIASVMADDQDQRLRQGTFGAIAGTSLGGLGAVFQKDPNLLLLGVFGSTSGAVLGWFIYSCLSVLGYWKLGRSLIEYHVGGLKAVKEKAEFDDRLKIVSALNLWSETFRGMVLRDTGEILGYNSPNYYDDWSMVVIRSWLNSLVLRFIRFIHRDAPVLVFPAKAGTHVWHGHRPSPVWQKL